MIRLRTGLLEKAGILVGALAMGCGGSDPATNDAGTGGGDVPTGMGRTYDYVINTLSIDRNTDATMAHTGFNVDGRFSPQAASMQMPADCSHGDYFSTIDPDQNMGSCPGASCRGGVDNQLPDLAEALLAAQQDIRRAITEQIQTGRLALLVRVSDVNGQLGPSLNDDSVNVRIYLGHPMVPASQCGQLFNGSAMFAVNTNSLTNPMDINSARYTFPARIRAGRLQISANPGAPFQFPLPAVMGVMLTLGIHQTQMRLSLTEMAGTNGNFGGYALFSELITTIRMAVPQFADLARNLLTGLIDVQTGTPPACDGMPNGGIAMGFGFTTTRAVIGSMAVSGPQPGMCGSSSGRDGGM